MITKISHPGSRVEEGNIDLVQYLKPLWYNKWKIALFSLVSTVLVAVWVSKVTPVYRANATLLIETREKQTISIDDIYGLETDKKEYLTTQYEILKSNNLSREVIEKLKLSQTKEFDPSVPKVESGPLSSLFTQIKEFVGIQSETVPLSPERQAYLNRQKVLEAFKARLGVIPIRDTQLVLLAFESEDPQLAADVVNSLGMAYINSHMSAKMAMTNTAMSWLQNRSESIDAELLTAAQKLQAFKNIEQIVDLEDGMQSMNSSTIKNINERFLEIRGKRIELENTLQQVRSMDSLDGEELQGSPLLERSVVLQNIRRAELEAETTFTELDQTYGPKHPKIIAAQAELKQIRNKLKTQIGKEVDDLRSQLNALKESQRQVSEQLKQAEGNFLSASEKEAEYRRLKGDVERLTELRDLIVTRFKEMDITSDFNAASARFTDEAEPPIFPVKPKKSLMIVLAMVISCFMACGFVLVSRAINNTYKSPDDIESDLNVKFLGILPRIKVKRGDKFPVYRYFDVDERLFTETVRTLRTSFLLHHINKTKTVTLVTSAVPNEGKTICAVNLAFSIGQMEKVIVIDADLRKPSVGKLFGLPGYQPGLANVLAETSELNECICHDSTSGIDILPAGQISSNALELLSSNRLEEILQMLRQKYDRIIIDSAPCHAASDALVISKVVDNTLVAIKAEDTSKEITKSAVARLLEAGANVEGAILTHVDINRKGSEYLGYFDYYDYAEKKDI